MLNIYPHKAFSRLFLVLLCFVVLNLSSFGQQAYVDSLEQELSMAEDDTVKVNILNTLSENVARKHKALRYAQEAGKLADKLFYKKGYIKSLKLIGVSYKKLGNNAAALKYYHKVASRYASIGDKSSLAAIYVLISEVHILQDQYRDALNNLLKALTIRELLGQKAEEVDVKTRIGHIHFKQKDYEKALDYYLSGLKYFVDFEDKLNVANTLDNVGLCFQGLYKYEEAIKYLKMSYSVRDAYRVERYLSVSLIKLGNCYKQMSDYSLALKSYKEALRIVEITGENEKILQSLLGVGEVYYLNGRHGLAEKYLERALFISGKYGLLKELSLAYELMALNFKKQGDYERAFDLYQYHSQLKDTMFSNEKRSQIAKMEAIFQTEKKAKEIEILNKENKLKDVEVSKQRVRNNSILISLILMTALVVLIFWSFLKIRGTNGKLKDQKKFVERANSNLTSSIQYARQIQEALLPDKKALKKILPNSFLILKPKDIVTGDFYWFKKIEDTYYVAAVDCTGHGVPGAFMSIICNQLLREVIVNQAIREPSEILKKLHFGIITALKKEEIDTFNVDGMDIALCAYGKADLKLRFASSSGRPLVVANERNEVDVVKGGQFPLGLITRKERSFEQSDIQLKAGDCFYIFTDGFEDQFGGLTGDKLTKKALIDELQRNSHKNLDSQKRELIAFFENWKGSGPQIDDVCVIGVKV